MRLLISIYTVSAILFSCSNDSEFTARSKKSDESKVQSADVSVGDSIGDESLGDVSGSDAIGDDVLADALESSLGTVIAGESGFKACEARSKVTDQPIEADVYRLESGIGSLPNLPGMTPVDKICMDNFDVPTRDFTEGFPGVRDLYEWFALRSRTKILIPVAGEYTFYLNSDDGSILYINGDKVIDNDGLHPTREVEAKIYLPVGAHTLDLWYYQGPATEIALQLFWSTPFKAEKHIVPKSSMRYYDK